MVFLVGTAGVRVTSGIQRVEARDAVERLTVLRTALTSQNHQAHRVSSAGTEKHCPGLARVRDIPEGVIQSEETPLR